MLAIARPGALALAPLSALALTLALGGCGTAPTPTPAGAEGVFASFTSHRIEIMPITSGSSGCGDDRTLAPNAFELHARPEGSADPFPLYLFLFKNEAAWRRAGPAVDACRGRWAERLGLAATARWDIAPYRAFAGPLPDQTVTLVEAVLRDAAAGSTGS